MGDGPACPMPTAQTVPWAGPAGPTAHFTGEEERERGQERDLSSEDRAGQTQTLTAGETKPGRAAGLTQLRNVPRKSSCKRQDI